MVETPSDANLSVDELVKEIARLRRRIFDLEEENDLLAVENERLRSLPVGGVAPCPTNAGPSTADKDAAGGSSIFGSWDEHSYLQGGTETFSMTETATVQGAGNGLNPLCCRLAVIGGRRVGFVGGVDKMVTAFSIDGNEKSIGSVTGFTGPVLSLDVRPGPVGEGEAAVLLVTCMDGSHALVSAAFEGPDRLKLDIIHQAKEHQKHAVVGRWAPDGSFYATGSHDKSAKLYRYNNLAADGQPRSELARELFFGGYVEALAMVLPVDSTTGEPWLIISTRGLPHLTYLGCVSGEQREVSLNASEWDTHVSFTVLSLSPSPCGRYLLAATDKARLIVYRMGTNTILRNLYGHQGNEYSNPRAIWHQSGKFISCSSEHPHQVVTWSVSSERVVGSLKGHTSTIRDVYCDPQTGALATVAYDKTLRVYA